MLKHRLIAVIIIRDGQVVQSVRFKHTNVIHYDIVHAIEAFNTWSVDEIVAASMSIVSRMDDRVSSRTWGESPKDASFPFRWAAG